MRAREFLKTAAEAQLKYGLGDPVAIVYVYTEDVFVKGGDTGRNREEVSRQLIKCAADELDTARKAASPPEHTLWCRGDNHEGPCRRGRAAGTEQ